LNLSSSGCPATTKDSARLVGGSANQLAEFPNALMVFFFYFEVFCYQTRTPFFLHEKPGRLSLEKQQD
jgi:hypothetical protein